MLSKGVKVASSRCLLGDLRGGESKVPRRGSVLVPGLWGSCARLRPRRGLSRGPCRGRHHGIVMNRIVCVIGFGVVLSPTGWRDCSRHLIDARALRRRTVHIRGDGRERSYAPPDRSCSSTPEVALVRRRRAPRRVRAVRGDRNTQPATVSTYFGVTDDRDFEGCAAVISRPGAEEPEPDTCVTAGRGGAVFPCAPSRRADCRHAGGRTPRAGV